MKYFVTALLVAASSAYAQDKTIEAIKKMATSGEDSRNQKCQDISGVFHVIKKLGEDRYLIGEMYYDNNEMYADRRYKFRDKKILEATRTVFNGKTQINNPLWAEMTNKKAPGEDGFDVPVVKETMDCAVAGSLRDYDKYAIAFAAKAGDLDLVKALEAKGQSINVQDSKGVSVLDIARQHKRTNVVVYLESKNAKGGKVNLTNDFVDILVKKKNLAKAKEIMKNGLDVNAKYDGAPVLYIAVRFGDLDMVKWLVEHGAKVDAEDDMQITSLIVAAYNGKRDVVQYLISRGANVNHVGEGDRTPASAAAEQGHKDIVKILKAAGAD